MSQLRSASTIEIEIQALLSHFGQSDLAADALLKKYSNEKLNLAAFEALATFLLHCGFYATLTDFVVQKLSSSQQVIPWGHFAEALFLSSAAVDADIKTAVVEGAEEQLLLSHLSRTHNLDHFEEELVRQRQLRRQSFIEKQDLVKKDLLNQLEVMRSQGLFQDEERVLEKLSKLFPDDPEIIQNAKTLKEKLALDFITKKPPQPRHKPLIFFHEPKDPKSVEILTNIEKAMDTVLKNNPQLASDFAVAQLQWDNEDAAFRLTQKSDSTRELDWLKAEILLQARLFVQLLDHLTWLETAYADDPETVFSIQYLRAQALWGLNQKDTAIEILEGLIQTRPEYRAAHSLLDEWKEDLL